MNIKLREYLANIDGDLILYDKFDDAIIGIGERCGIGSVLVYDKDKIIHIIMNEYDVNYEEAMQEYDNNIIGAYLGEKTPMVVESIEDIY